MQFSPFRKDLQSLRHLATAAQLPCCSVPADTSVLLIFMLFCSPSLQQTTRPQPQAQWGNAPVMWFLKFGSVFLPLAKVYPFPHSEPILSQVNDSCVNAFECCTWLFVFIWFHNEFF